MVDEYEAEAAAGSYNLPSMESTVLSDQKLASNEKAENSEESSGDPLYEDYENNTGEIIGECNVCKKYYELVDLFIFRLMNKLLKML